MINSNLLYNKRCGYIVFPGDMGSLYCQLPALYVDTLLGFDHSWLIGLSKDCLSFKASESILLFDLNKIKPTIAKDYLGQLKLPIIPEHPEPL